MNLQVFLGKALNISRFLGTSEKTALDDKFNRILEPIKELLDVALVPFLIAYGTAGVFYAIFLGVMYSKAESEEQRGDARKRIINFVIGFVCILVLLVILTLIVKYGDSIGTWVSETVRRNQEKPAK